MTGSPRPVTVEDLIALNERIVRCSGGEAVVCRRDRLQYAVDRPFMVFGSWPRYPSPYHKAAAMMEIITWDRPFEGGNESTALAAGVALLWVLTGRRVCLPTAEGLQVAQAVSRRELGTDDLARWFKAVSSYRRRC